MKKTSLVFKKLHELITSGYFRPGENLKEREVAEMLGVSRTPVREAFNKLELDGIVINKGRKGMMIPKFSYNEVKNLYTVREYIEGLAAKTVAENRNEKIINDLYSNIQQAKKAGNENNRQEQIAINGDFHKLIAEHTNNSYITNIFRSLQSSINLMRSTSLSVEGRLSSNVEEHLLIVKAIEIGDAELAEKQARTHIKNSLQHVLIALESQNANNKVNLDIYS